MSEAADLPEPDRLEGAPHPRETERLFGQEKAERAFLAALRSGRLHHAWLIHGPRGTGKATLAWRIARFLLSQGAPGGRGADDAGLFAGEAPAPASSAPAPASSAPAPAPGAPAPNAQAPASGAPAPVPESLDTDPDTPLAHRLRALAEPRLFLLRRPVDEKTGRLRQQITVDEVRRLKNFFAMSAADGGRRIVIIDSADEMNQSAANALLKILEEPPEGAVLLLVSHQPARLLPTIRSRCRDLRCHPLSPGDLARALAQAGAEADPGRETALAALAGGSAGEAIRLSALGGLAAYGEICALFSAPSGPDRARALALAESAAARGEAGAERLDLLLHLFDLFLARLARTGAAGPHLVEAGEGEGALMARLAPGPAAGRAWAALQQELGARARQGRAVNLDPAALILDMIFRIEETAARHAARSR